MELSVGEIFSGKVTGITKFGAFVALPEGKNGMVHISEVAPTYVGDIREHLTEGQEVKVKVIAIDEQGRVNLSIKKAMETPRNGAGNRRPRPNNNRGGERKDFQNRDGANREGGFNQNRRRPQKQAQEQEEMNPTDRFNNMLKHFMQDSESRMSDIRHNMDRKNGSRRRK